ncbi:hypothetical protein oki361_16000 [Helicobacter pylori]
MIEEIFVFQNAFDPIFSKPSFKVISVKFVQLENAELSISLIDSGNIIDLTI